MQKKYDVRQYISVNRKKANIYIPGWISQEANSEIVFHALGIDICVREEVEYK